MPVFDKGYAYTGSFQLPLFNGSPDIKLLQQTVQGPIEDWIARSLENKVVGMVGVLNVK